MNSRRLLFWFYRLSWKKLASFSLIALAIAATPLIINSANTRTRTQSEAALINPKPQTVTTQFVAPKGPPQIYLVDHFFGKAEDAVLVHGANLGGLNDRTSVNLNGQTIAEENLVAWTADYIEFKLPTGAKSGKVGVDILGNKTEWPGTFWVVNETTPAELHLEKLNELQARLTSKAINGNDGLLIWLLVYQGEDKNIEIVPAKGVNLQTQTRQMPIGKVYELTFQVNPGGEWTTLATVTKKPDQLVGIARAESLGAPVPIKSHPLFVSF